MKEQATFLIIEDNADQATLLRRAFTKAKLINPIRFVNSAEQAIAYLTGAGAYQNRQEYPLPALILLDLKTPGMNGYGFLAWLRAQPDFQQVRAIVLSGSSSMHDINLAYRLGADSCLVNPVDSESFVQLSQALNGYWVWLEHDPRAATADRPPRTDEELTVMEGRGPLPRSDCPRDFRITVDTGCLP